MQLSKQTDYSLRVLMYLAANPDRLCTIPEIAARYEISRAHLMKVVNALAREGFVATTRGRAGGLRLAGDGASIRVGDVVRRMECRIALVECQRPGGRCLISPSCRLKGVLAGAAAAFLAALDAVTLADLCRENPDLAALLGERAA